MILALIRRALLLAPFALLGTPAHAEPATAARDIEIRAEPKNDAALTGKLARGARFEMLKRQGVWAQISADGREGWVLFFYLSFGEAPKPSAGSELAGATRLLTGRQGDITATIGARGLSEDQLRSANFNADELKRLQGYAVAPETAEQFARQGGLEPRRVEMPAANRAAAQ